MKKNLEHTGLIWKAEVSREGGGTPSLSQVTRIGKRCPTTTERPSMDRGYVALGQRVELLPQTSGTQTMMEMCISVTNPKFFLQEAIQNVQENKDNKIYLLLNHTMLP